MSEDRENMILGWCACGAFFLFTWGIQCMAVGDSNVKDNALEDRINTNDNALEDRIIRLEALHEAENKR